MIELKEYTSTVVELQPGDLEYLVSNHERHLEITPARPSGFYCVRARQFVGVIRTPHDEIRIIPKMEMPSLLFLLSQVYELAEFREEQVGLASQSDVLDFVVEEFLRQVETLATRGLLRGYRSASDDLTFMRGKLMVGELWRNTGRGRLTLPCAFEDFTEDVVLNQMIRYELDLLRLTGLGRALQRQRLRRCRELMAGVTPTSWKTDPVAELQYDRLTAHYRPIHRLAQLILDATGLEHQSGDVGRRAFLLDMNRLFEGFVAGWLRENAPSGVNVIPQSACRLDAAGIVDLRPDLLLIDEGGGVLVADTKYKLKRNVGVANEDIYQALAYCRGLQIPIGYLVFPDWTGSQQRIETRDGENVIVLDGVDLAGDPDAIREGLTGLFGRMQSDLRVPQAAAS